MSTLVTNASTSGNAEVQQDTGKTSVGKELEHQVTTQQSMDPLDQLVSTLDHVFSREYLSRDPTFVSYLNTTNNEFSVSIDVVAELPIVRAHLVAPLPPTSNAWGEATEVGGGVLVYREKVVENKGATTTDASASTPAEVSEVTAIAAAVAAVPQPEQPDMELLKVALRKCTNLIFEEGKLLCMPTTKLVQRTTLILRDVPADTKDEEVRAIFAGSPTSSSILQTHPEIGNNYFVTFADEESTTAAFSYLRTPGVEFRGKSVSARIKSESLLKNSYYVDPAVQRYQQQQDQPQTDNNPYWDARQGYSTGGRGGRGGRYNNNGRRGGGRGGSANKEYTQSRKQYNTRYNNANTTNATTTTNTNTNTSTNTNTTNNSSNNNSNTSGYKRGSFVPSAKESTSNATNNNATRTQNANASLNGTSNWPPLQDKSQSGYNRAFQKYSRQQIVSIISALNSAASTTSPTALTTAATTVANTSSSPPSPTSTTTSSASETTETSSTGTTTTPLPTATATRSTPPLSPTASAISVTAVAEPPQWAVSISQIPSSIYSAVPNVSMEILRPVQDTHVEFSDSKRSRRRPSKGLPTAERKKSASEGKPPTTTSTTTTTPTTTATTTATAPKQQQQQSVAPPTKPTTAATKTIPTTTTTPPATTASTATTTATSATAPAATAATTPATTSTIPTTTTTTSTTPSKALKGYAEAAKATLPITS